MENLPIEHLEIGSQTQGMRRDVIPYKDMLFALTRIAHEKGIRGLYGKRRLYKIRFQQYSRTFIQSWILQGESSRCYNSRQRIQDTCKCCAGLRSLRPIEPPSSEALRSPIETAAAKVSGSPAITNDNPVNCKVKRISSVRPSPIIELP
ncbi:hypothetical protein CMV_011244 [Castanea mollissima]|uniref:Uncharacterized protein n=1 Tax=Castanea mollissima TaxID=60419 RepID=A0A8J4VKZ5_9ROSI|nr:hypothetical protein CMV_011244 [Castanea mollissima]